MIKRYKDLFQPGSIKILFILMSSQNGMRFTELMLDLKMSPSVLSKYLTYLKDTKVIVKDEDKYTLTNKGVNLVKKIYELINLMED